jgi:hypothetical protein
MSDGNDRTDGFASLSMTICLWQGPANQAGPSPLVWFGWRRSNGDDDRPHSLGSDVGMHCGLLADPLGNRRS